MSKCIYCGELMLTMGNRHELCEAQRELATIMIPLVIEKAIFDGYNMWDEVQEAREQASDCHLTTREFEDLLGLAWNKAIDRILAEGALTEDVADAMTDLTQEPEMSAYLARTGDHKRLLNLQAKSG